MNKRIKSLSKNFSVKHLILILLSLLIITQIYLVFDGYAFIDLKRVWRNRNLPATERGMLFYLGETGLEYFKFVADIVPEGMTIITPDIPGDLSRQSIWQFVLMPRTVRSCGCESILSEGYATEECKACLLQRNHYLPAIGDFPPPEILDGEKEFIPFLDGEYWYKGIYVPLNTEHETGLSIVQGNLPVYVALIIDFLAILLIFTLGCSLTLLVDSEATPLEATSLGIPLGVGVMTISVFILSWMGIKLSGIMYGSVLIGWMAVINILRWRRAGRNWVRPTFGLMNRLLSGMTPLSWLEVFLGAIILLFFLVTMIVSIGRGYSLYDGISHWATKGYGIALEQSIFGGDEWGGVSLAYPLNVHLFIAMFRLLDGDIVPGSKMIFTIFSLSLMIGCYAFWRKQNTDRIPSLIGVLILFSVPAIYYWSTLGWANLIMSVYLVLGTLWIILGQVRHKRSSLIIGGLLLGFAGWTRPEGIGYAIVILVVVAVSTGMITRRRANLLLPLGLVVLITAPYFLFSASEIWHSHLGGAVRGYSEGVQVGRVGLEPLAFVFQVFVDHLSNPHRWGLIVIFVIIAVVFFHKQLSPRVSPIPLTLLLSALALGATTILILYVRFYSRGGYIEFLHRVLDRHILPSVILLIVFTVLIIGTFTHNHFAASPVGSRSDD